MIDVYVNIFFLSFILFLFIIKRKNAGPEHKLIGGLVLISLPLELYAGYLQSFSINNLFIYHILTPVQYVFYSGIYYYSIESPAIKKLILWSIPFVAISAVIITFTWQPAHTYNSYTIAFSNLLICLWILLYYRQLFVQLKIVNLKIEPLFWISTGLLFFALGDFFVEGLMNALLEQSFATARWFYYNVYLSLLCLLYLMFVISFLCRDIFKKATS